MKHARGSWFKVVASVTGVLICVGLPSASARPQQSPYALACNRNHSLTGYTFHMNVALAMHHFPWLHFHISGIGQNVRGRRYIVRFTKMPFFARGFHTIDLSALDPSMWKSRYNVRLVARRGSMTMFSLLPRGTASERKNQLRVAYVTLDAKYATRVGRAVLSQWGQYYARPDPGERIRLLVARKWRGADRHARRGAQRACDPNRLCNRFAAGRCIEPKDIMTLQLLEDKSTPASQTRRIRQGDRRASDLFWGCLRPRFFDFALGRNVCAGAWSRTFCFLH